MYKKFADLFIKHFILASVLILTNETSLAAEKTIVYLTPGLDLPFWRTLGLGVKGVAESNGYKYQFLDSMNSDEKQYKNAKEVIAKGVAGIVLSPTDSKSAPIILNLASKAHIPVVIADIGTNGGEYLSYIKSDNYKGAYGVGEALARVLKEKNISNPEFALCTISLARKNGQDRTNGFMDAMKEAGFTNMVALKQMQTYTIEETHKFVDEIIGSNPKLNALFVEVDKPTLGALSSIKQGKKNKQVLLASFDGIPEFIDLLKSDSLVVVGMQQPYLMGSKSAESLISYFNGKQVEKQIVVPVLIVTNKNLNEIIPIANKTVFGLEVK